MVTNCYTPGVLSCEPEWSARVCTPGGQTTIVDLNPFITAGNFTRVIDATSSANVSMPLQTKAAQMCCKELSRIGGGWGCMELEIRRDAGDGWAGPITVPRFRYGRLELIAQDLTAWWRRRTLGNLSFTQTDLSTIFLAVHNNAMAEDPILGFNVIATPSGVLGDRTVLASDDTYAVDVLSELARTGVDYTAVNRDVYVGAQSVDPNPIGLFNDDDWVGDGPTVEWAGDLYASRVIVHGGNGLRAVAEQDANARTCGLVTRVFREESILDQNSLQQAADNRLSVLSNPWRITSDGEATLKCGTGVDFAALIPGARARVTTSIACEDITADFRLVRVNADLKKNTVGIAFAPLGIGGYVETNDKA